MNGFPVQDEIIDLERRYVPISFNEKDKETLAIENQIALLYGRTYGDTIYDLIKNPLTVVFGEAQSGKTTEFRIASKNLNQNGKYAFFILIEELSNPRVIGPQAISDALEIEDENKFENWIKSNKDAVFLLDSVDETKLKNPHDYQRAIRNFQKSLSPHLRRCRVIISCRISEWHPKTDFWPLQELISNLIKDPDHTNEVKLVQLLPLDEGQVRKIAKKRGLDEKDAYKFIQELKDVQALDFAGRPGDAIELVELWKQERRFGTLTKLTELTEQNIQRKLKEESDVYEARISLKKARLGAERLAAAAIFCNQSTFRFATPSEDPRDVLPALDPFKLLPEWSKEEIKALLRRPIFDEATYGRVRFHTRTVKEYLAASWLKRRYDKGCPVREIANIFFATRYGKTVIRRKFSSVAAWLAPHVPVLLKKLYLYNPEVLPDEGDPQALPMEIRESILRSFVERYSDRDHTGYWYDFQKLRQFADPGLSDCIRELLNKAGTTVDAKRLLLDLVQTGKIHGCSKEVLKTALDEREDEGVRIDAILALKPYATEEELQKVFETLKKESAVPRDIYGWALYVLYPRLIGPEELLGFIEAIPQKGFNKPERLKDRFGEILEAENDKERLKVLIPGLWNLMNSADWAENTKKDKNSFSWLLGGLVKGLYNWFSANGTFLSNLFDILDFFEDENFFDFQERKLVDKLKNKFSKADSKVRKNFFRHRFSLFAKHYNKKKIYTSSVLNSSVILDIVFDDLNWLIEDCLNTSNSRYRFTAFDAAVRVCLSEKDKCDPHERLHQIIEKHPDLKKHLEGLLNPPPNRYELAQKLKQEIKKLKKRRDDIVFAEDILPHLEDISYGKDEQRLVRIFRYWQKLDNKRYPSSFDSLIPLIGEKGVAAFRSGLIAFVKKWEPDDQKRVGDEMAILGISCAIEDGWSFDGLPQPQIIKFIKLALKDFDLPEWFGDLIEKYPKIVASQIKPIIFQELESVESAHEDTNAHPHFFSNLIREYPESVNLFADEIFMWAEKHMPLSPNMRTHIVRAFSIEKHRKRLKLLAEHYFKVYESTSKEDQLFWLAVWLQVDALRALDKLEEMLSTLELEEADKFILDLSNILYRRYGYDTGFEGIPDYQSIDALSRFIPIVFSHIRFEEDPEREGTWTPDKRDNAQGFRDELVKSLANLPGKESYLALKKIRDDVSYPGVKDWLLREIEEKIDRESPLVWSEDTIIEFEKSHEHDPLTVDDLFEIALKRIEEIKYDMEKGDFSNRGLFTEDTDETELQKFIAQKLKDLSRGRYTVVREPEVANKKKPDIRLLHLNLQPVSIEIKWAHKWSIAELEEALVDQLVGLYLKAVDSTHGIYLLVNARYGRTWKFKDKRLDFNGLVRHMKRLAKKIESEKEGVERLEVVGMDLT